MFKTLLKDNWSQLPPVIRAHYALDNNQCFKMQGKLTVKHGGWFKILKPLMRLSGALVPVAGKFSVIVENTLRDNVMYWRRQFENPSGCYVFNSKMQAYNNEIIEQVGLGLGIRMELSQTERGIVYHDKGYVFKLGKQFIPLPLQFIMGKAVIKEYVSETNTHDFNMSFTLIHPWFGFVFGYSGYFNVIKNEQVKRLK